MVPAVDRDRPAFEVFGYQLNTLLSFLSPSGSLLLHRKVVSLLNNQIHFELIDLPLNYIRPFSVPSDIFRRKPAGG